MGWWVTESTKVPVTFTEGEFAGQANPADIRGSYTFGDIANSFDVTPEVLAQAFGVTGDDPAAFAIKELEAIYLDSGYEIGTVSVLRQNFYWQKEISRWIKSHTSKRIPWMWEHRPRRRYPQHRWFHPRPPARKPPSKARQPSANC
jgi:hypothetical protein